MNRKLFTTILLMAALAAAAAAQDVHRLHALAEAGGDHPGDRFLATHEGSPVLFAAWGESEAAQLLLVAPQKGWRGLRLSFDGFRHLETGEDSGDFRAMAELADGPAAALRSWDEPLDLDGEATLQVWLQLRAPEDARPGRHRGMIRLAAEGWSDSLALDLEVWPFELIGLPTVKFVHEGEAPVLDQHWLREQDSRAVRIEDAPAGDLPGIGRILPAALWRAGIDHALLPPVEDSRRARRLADGLEDLDYLVLLEEEDSDLADALLARFPVRGLVDRDADPQSLLHWRLAAGSCLAGEEDFARQWLRQMEARPEHGGRPGLPLIDPGDPAEGWRGGRDREAIAGMRPGLAVTLDGDDSQLRAEPRLRDWREAGHLEMEIRLAEGPPARVDLFLERRGFRRQSWTWRLHLRAGETRKIRVPLPFGQFDLGRVSAWGLRLVDGGEARRLEIREPLLR